MSSEKEIKFFSVEDDKINSLINVPTNGSQITDFVEVNNKLYAYSNNTLFKIEQLNLKKVTTFEFTLYDVAQFDERTLLIEGLGVLYYYDLASGSLEKVVVPT